MRIPARKVSKFNEVLAWGLSGPLRSCIYGVLSSKTGKYEMFPFSFRYIQGFPSGFFLGDICPPASVKWGTSDNFRGQNISATAKIAFDFKSCMNTHFLKCFFNSSFPRTHFCVYKNLLVLLILLLFYNWCTLAITIGLSCRCPIWQQPS